MAYVIQVAVDTKDSHAQADWWAETLGWVVEPSDQAFIDAMIARGKVTNSASPDPRRDLVPRGGLVLRPGR
ncbi:hypothetical protein KIH31_01560 [Paenarthrobacter sp. DKR-5]|uniref:VOC family protein n=1 Tax=Paenarthrobacter sp. DKR-5 TaxID=2835535 RepID=UPI001BDCA3E9|nr:VOC family protein [Paenarthrobacter sp. DKR-5]MBT1001276.1 hypothetical protein [Paenarthrobacter sp. DKR-5]